MFFIFSVIILVFCIGLILLAGKSSITSKWGINPFRVNCPKCTNRMPIVRNPTSTHQALWGGWTCAFCGCEMDKYGKEISIDVENKLSSKQLEQSKMKSIKSFDEKGKTPLERIFEENDK